MLILVFFVIWCNLFTKGCVLSNIEPNFIVKTNLLQTSFFQLATFLLFSLFLSNTGFSIRYTSIADGSYNDCSIWDNGCPNNTIQVGDTVIINHVVNASSSMNVIGVLIVNVSGDFSTNNDMETQIGSTFIVDGSFGLTGELEVNGEMFNSGFSSIEFLHNDGYICNSGSITCSDRVRNHGGLIECGGTISTCEIDMENNASAEGVTGSIFAEISEQNLCCDNPNNPDPFDELSGDWFIDSSNVSICILPLMPDAGDNDVSSTCNDSESFIDLNTLISSGSDLGSFTETSASGAFDPVTGILNTDNLTPGTYSFIYTVNGYNSTVDESFFEITIFPVLNTTSSFTTCENELPFQWNGMALEQEGDYSVALTSVVTGCDSVASLTLTVQALEMPEILSQGTVECPSDIIDLSVEDVSGAEFYWAGPMEYESQDLVNAFELDDSNSGLYSVYYVLNGCESEVAQIELNVENIFEYKQFEFPNVITANDDSVNDEIEVEKYVGNCSDFSLTVRDRWGNQVYVQERGEPSFNGNSILGEKLPEGVYFYNLIHSQGSKTGFIHLLK